MRWLLLPDAWRIELLRRPLERADWLLALEQRPALRLIDWACPRPAAHDTLLVPRLDLAAAELVLKIAPEVRVLVGATAPALPGARARLLAAARTRAHGTLALAAGHTLPPFAGPFLDALLRRAEETR